jgi:hypothetical protein
MPMSKATSPILLAAGHACMHKGQDTACHDKHLHNPDI